MGVLGGNAPPLLEPLLNNFLAQFVKNCLTGSVVRIRMMMVIMVMIHILARLLAPRHFISRCARPDLHALLVVIGRAARPKAGCQGIGPKTENHNRAQALLRKQRV